MQHPQHVFVHLTDFQKTSRVCVSVCDNVSLDLLVLLKYVCCLCNQTCKLYGKCIYTHDFMFLANYIIILSDSKDFIVKLFAIVVCCQQNEVI